MPQPSGASLLNGEGQHSLLRTNKHTNKKQKNKKRYGFTPFRLRLESSFRVRLLQLLSCFLAFHAIRALRRVFWGVSGGEMEMEEFCFFAFLLCCFLSFLFLTEEF
ncbi:uncharacterized protein IWZ02DRAFT_99365 [Phyllosticta citriasiana]|uniref:uncharacterized protein n=1 Tax=Phyllosticta citriasiana TaxID=595635 RepID=UPI0030FD526F